MIRFSNKLLVSLSVAMFGTHLALALPPENDRYISLRDLYKDFHYTQVFSLEEQKEIEEALRIFKNEKVRRMLEQNLKCFSKDEQCERFSLSHMFAQDPEIKILNGGTPRNGKAFSENNKKWFFHFAHALPNGSYPFANLFRAPFARKLQDIVGERNLRIKVSRQAVFPLYEQNTFFKSSPSLEDAAVYSFIVIADFETMVSSYKQLHHFLKEHPQRELLADQVRELVTLTGMADITAKNIGLESEEGKIVLYDTEPLYGEVLLIETEYNTLLKKPYDFTFPFYSMNREELAKLSGFNSLILLLTDESKPGTKRAKSSSEEDDQSDAPPH